MWKYNFLASVLQVIFIFVCLKHDFNFSKLSEILVYNQPQLVIYDPIKINKRGTS